MRLLASLPDEDQASRFGDYLLTLGIDNSVEEGVSGWSVWVSDDDKIEAAKRELEQFLAIPNDPRYSSAGRNAARMRTRQAKQAQRRAEKFVDVRTQWARSATAFKPITTALIVLCCIVGIVTLFGRRPERLSGLRISARNIEPEFAQIGPVRGLYWPISELTEVREGQVWRLLTPILIHYGIFHLLFNMFWLRDLGFMIEQQKGAWWLAILVLVIGIPSNLAQYVMAGPWFGGMSGVVYGLFGYVWMKGKYSPHKGMALHPHTVFYMIAWFVLCFTGWVGAIANTAHAVGLLIGVAFGIAGYLKRRLLS
jgi:GlpG protein